MLLPSKITPFRESIFPDTIVILSILYQSDKSVFELRQSCNDQISDVSYFFTLLDFLFAIGKIEINLKTRKLHYVA